MRSWADIAFSTRRPILSTLSSLFTSPIHLAAYFGFEDVIKSQLSNLSEGTVKELLLIVAAADHFQVAKILLNNEFFSPEDISGFLAKALTCRSNSLIAIFTERFKLAERAPDIGILLEKSALIGCEHLLVDILGSNSRRQLTRAHMTEALCAAATVGNDAAVKRLLDSGALAQIKVEDLAKEASLRPLHSTVLTGHTRILSDLIQNLEHDSQQIHQQDVVGRTPLHLASMIGFSKMVEQLTRITPSLDLNSKLDDFGRAPLHYASFYGHTESVKALVSSKADLEVKNWKGRTALHIAVGEQRQATVDQLLELGANPNVLDKHGKSPLYIAVAVKSFQIVEILLNHKVEVNRRNYRGSTPLLLAAQLGLANIFELLKNNKGDLTSQDDEGLTPLHWASKNGHPDLVHLMLEIGLDVAVTDKSMLRPVHHAAASGNFHCLRHLLENGADIESRTPQGNTPLHIAAEKENLDSIALLLSKRGDRNKLD